MNFEGRFSSFVHSQALVLVNPQHLATAEVVAGGCVLWQKCLQKCADKICVFIIFNQHIVLSVMLGNCRNEPSEQRLWTWKRLPYTPSSSRSALVAPVRSQILMFLFT